MDPKRPQVPGARAVPPASAGRQATGRGAGPSSRSSQPTTSRKPARVRKPARARAEKARAETSPRSGSKRARSAGSARASSRRAQARQAVTRFTTKSANSRAEAIAEGRPYSGIWLGSLRVSGLSILVGGLVVLGIGVLAPQINIFVQQRHEVADLQEQVRQQTADLEVLQKERARWEDPAYIRAQARQRLFYVMPGDISFIVIDDVAVEDKPKAKPTATLRKTETDWVAGLMNSVFVAGLSTATPQQLDAAATQTGSQ